MTHSTDEISVALTQSQNSSDYEGDVLRFSVARESPSLLLLILKGELDLVAANKVQEVLTEALLDPECKDVIADMSELMFLDSAGLGMFITVLRSLEERGGSVSIAGCHPSVRRALTITRLDRVFQIFDSVSEARAAL
jgi:anti-anti-sigma factor